MARLEQQGVGRGMEDVPSSLEAQALLQSTYNRFGAGLDTVRKGPAWFGRSQSLNSKPQGLWQWNQPFSFKQG